MTEKKRHSARALRDRKRLSRYFHTHGYGRLAGGYAPKKDDNIYRSRIIFVILAILLLGIGLFYVFF